MDHPNPRLLLKLSRQSATLSVTGPLATDNYSGPTEFVVYQDNIHGTFMFYPLR
jgi:hypothetical protein